MSALAERSFWGWSGSGSVIQDDSDHGASKGPIKPLWSRIHRFLWSTMIWVILDSDPDHPMAQKNAFTDKTRVLDSISESPLNTDTPALPPSQGFYPGFTCSALQAKVKALGTRLCWMLIGLFQFQIKGTGLRYETNEGVVWLGWPRSEGGNSTNTAISRKITITTHTYSYNTK